MVAATLCWGLNFVITKSATGSNPDQFRIFIYNIIRFPAAAILLFATALLTGQKILIGGRDLATTALLAFVGIFVYQILYMNGQTMTDSANIGMLYSVAPLLIVIISLVTGIERPTVFIYAGGIFGFIGLILILFKGGNFTLDKGSLLFFTGLVCWAIYAVFSKPVLDRHSPLSVTAWVVLFGSVFQIPLAVYQLPSQNWHTLADIHILYVVMSAILSLYTGYSLFYYSVAKIGPAKTGIYTNLTPVFTLMFAVLLRGESIGMIQFFGFIFIVTGIFIAKIPVRTQEMNHHT